MNTMEHFNFFCVEFGKAKSLFDTGKKESVEFLKCLENMSDSYHELNENMVNYIKRWNLELVRIGFWIKHHNPWVGRELPRVDISDIMKNEEEYKVSGDVKHVKIREDISHTDGKKVLVGNYCEFSTPWSNMEKKEKDSILKKTMENIRNTELGIMDPSLAKKKQRRIVRPPIWTISDSERDW